MLRPPLLELSPTIFVAGENTNNGKDYYHPSPETSLGVTDLNLEPVVKIIYIHQL
jgi:hypothetical protein